MLLSVNEIQLRLLSELRCFRGELLHTSSGLNAGVATFEGVQIRGRSPYYAVVVDSVTVVSDWY